MPDRRKMQIITQTLIQHGHYEDPEGPMGGTVIEWMQADAENVLTWLETSGLPPYTAIDGALVDSAVHDATDCNDLCVRDLVAALDSL